MNDLTVDGMVISPSVVETIVSIAVNDVEGVAAVGSAGTANRSLRSMLGAKPSTHGIDVDLDADGKLQVAVHIEAYYGSVLPEVAAAVREAIAQAFESQLGVSAGSVDVFVDGIRFVR